MEEPQHPIAALSHLRYEENKYIICSLQKQNIIRPELRVMRDRNDPLGWTEEWSQTKPWRAEDVLCGNNSSIASVYWLMGFFYPYCIRLSVLALMWGIGLLIVQSQSVCRYLFCIYFIYFLLSVIALVLVFSNCLPSVNVKLELK